MSIHYLFDLFNDRIKAIRPDPPNGQTPVAGQYVIMTSSEFLSSPPTSRADLLTKKHAALLASYAGFQYITYDDMLDATGVDLNASSIVFAGLKGVNSISYTGSLTSVATVLSSTPNQAVVNFEPFTFLITDPRDGVYTRTFQELPHTECQLAVSYNNGSTFNTILPGVLTPIAVPDQGNQFIIRLNNISAAFPPNRVYFGGWSVVY